MSSSRTFILSRERVTFVKNCINDKIIRQTNCNLDPLTNKYTNSKHWFFVIPLLEKFLGPFFGVLHKKISHSRDVISDHIRNYQFDCFGVVSLNDRDWLEMCSPTAWRGVPVTTRVELLTFFPFGKSLMTWPVTSSVTGCRTHWFFP